MNEDYDNYVNIDNEWKGNNLDYSKSLQFLEESFPSNLGGKKGEWRHERSGRLRAHMQIIVYRAISTKF